MPSRPLKTPSPRDIAAEIVRRVAEANASTGGGYIVRLSKRRGTLAPSGLTKRLRALAARVNHFAQLMKTISPRTTIEIAKTMAFPFKKARWFSTVKGGRPSQGFQNVPSFISGDPDRVRTRLAAAMTNSAVLARRIAFRSDHVMM